MLFAFDNFVHVTGGKVNIFGVKLTHRHNLFNFNDAGASSSCHIRVEIASTLAKLNISFLVGSLGFHERKVAANRLFKNKVAPVKLTHLLGF